MTIRQGNNIIAGKVIQGGLEIGDIGTALYVNEAQGMRRYLNGSIVVINDNTQAFADKIKQITFLYPELACTETEWQAEALMNVDRCVYKFVIDETFGTIRLPRYPEYVEVTKDKLGVVGNGMALGFDSTATNNYQSLQVGANLYGSSIGTSYVSSIQDSHYGSMINNTSLGITTNPTKSGVETSSDSVTKLKLKYFIQIATGQGTQADVTNQIILNNPFSLFDSRYSDHELKNLSWLHSNGQLNSAAVYPSAYEALLEILSGAKTVEGISVKTIDEEYTDFDFVVDMANEQFRLPKKMQGESIYGTGHGYLIEKGEQDGVNYRIYADGYCVQWSSKVNNTSSTEVTVTLAKEYKDADYALLCVNHESSTYAWSNRFGYSKTTTGFKYVNGVGYLTDWKTSGYLADSEVRTNLRLYYYVGEATQNVNLIDAGRIQEQIALKLDTGRKAEIISWGMPDYSAGITLAKADGEAPLDGYIKIGTVNNVVSFTIAIANSVFKLSGEYTSSDMMLIPISKGETYTCAAWGAIATLEFIPMKGAN